MVQVIQKALTLDEFLQLPETKPASEYIDGQIIQKPIPQGNYHIEHFKPQGIDETVRFDYFNLIVSCQGEDQQPRVPVHCGHQKDNWYDEKLLVSPLIANCAGFFKYSAAGEILPTEETNKKLAAETTIEKLALNIPNLKRMRQAAIDAELKLLEDEDFNEEEIRNIIKDYLELNNDGKYQPFCVTIVYILENYYCNSIDPG